MDRYPEPMELRPFQNRRVERALRAKEIRHKTIPDLMRTCPRAKHGIAKAELIIDPPAVVESPQDGPHILPPFDFKIRVNQLDTLSAAARISQKVSATRRGTQQSSRVAVLNMASASWPGGAFLEGGNRQEEYLCGRTTLYPSLWNAWYPLPEISGIYSPDVLVFRDNLTDSQDLPKNDRYFIDVISSNMPKFGESRNDICTCGVSYCDRHRDMVMRKMKAVLRIAQRKGVDKLILGAWGCGKANNPVKEIAKCWRKVIAGGPRQRRPNAERWDGIKEIQFAIPERDWRHEFELAFKDVLADDTFSPSSSDDFVAPGAEDSEQQTFSDLLTRMAEIELRLDQTQNLRMRNTLRQNVADVQREMHQNSRNKASNDGDQEMQDTPDPEDEEDYEYVLPLASDQELDDDEIFYALSSSSSPTQRPRAEVECYEFRPSAPELLDSHPSLLTEDESQDEHLAPPPTLSQRKRYPPQFDPATGWYNGSVDGLTAYLQGTGRLKLSSSRGSPEVVRPDSGGMLNADVLRNYLGQFGGSDVLDE